MSETMVERLAKRWYEYTHGEPMPPDDYIAVLYQVRARWWLRAVAEEVESGQEQEEGWSAWSAAHQIPFQLRTEADR